MELAITGVVFSCFAIIFGVLNMENLYKSSLKRTRVTKQNDEDRASVLKQDEFSIPSESRVVFPDPVSEHWSKEIPQKPQIVWQNLKQVAQFGLEIMWKSVYSYKAIK